MPPAWAPWALPFAGAPGLLDAHKLHLTGLQRQQCSRVFSDTSPSSKGHDETPSTSCPTPLASGCNVSFADELRPACGFAMPRPGQHPKEGYCHDKRAEPRRETFRIVSEDENQCHVKFYDVSPSCRSHDETTSTSCRTPPSDSSDGGDADKLLPGLDFSLPQRPEEGHCLEVQAVPRRASWADLSLSDDDELHDAPPPFRSHGETPTDRSTGCRTGAPSGCDGGGASAELRPERGRAVPRRAPWADQSLSEDDGVTSQDEDVYQYSAAVSDAPPSFRSHDETPAMGCQMPLSAGCDGYDPPLECSQRPQQGHRQDERAMPQRPRWADQFLSEDGSASEDGDDSQCADAPTDVTSASIDGDGPGAASGSPLSPLLQTETSSPSEDELRWLGRWTVGAKLHKKGGCRPCLFFQRPTGCNNGEQCRFCHLSHKRRRRHRVPEKSQRPCQDPSTAICTEVGPMRPVDDDVAASISTLSGQELLPPHRGLPLGELPSEVPASFTLEPSPLTHSSEPFLAATPPSAVVQAAGSEVPRPLLPSSALGDTTDEPLLAPSSLPPSCFGVLRGMPSEDGRSMDALRGSGEASTPVAAVDPPLPWRPVAFATPFEEDLAWQGASVGRWDPDISAGTVDAGLPGMTVGCTPPLRSRPLRGRQSKDLPPPTDGTLEEHPAIGARNTTRKVQARRGSAQKWHPSLQTADDESGGMPAATRRDVRGTTAQAPPAVTEELQEPIEQPSAPGAGGAVAQSRPWPATCAEGPAVGDVGSPLFRAPPGGVQKWRPSLRAAGECSSLRAFR